MTFGEKVKSLRTTKNMSQAQLAQELGVALRTVSGWENQNRYPKKHDLYQKLSDILGCDISYLMSEEESFITEAAEQFGSRGARLSLIHIYVPYGSGIEQAYPFSSVNISVFPSAVITTGLAEVKS